MLIQSPNVCPLDRTEGLFGLEDVKDDMFGHLVMAEMMITSGGGAVRATHDVASEMGDCRTVKADVN